MHLQILRSIATARGSVVYDRAHSDWLGSISVHGDMDGPVGAARGHNRDGQA